MILQRGTTYFITYSVYESRGVCRGSQAKQNPWILILIFRSSLMPLTPQQKRLLEQRGQAMADDCRRLGKDLLSERIVGHEDR